MIGNTLSHYKIISKLGQGGMGEVYLAEDSRLDRKVALKILPQHLSERAELRERFEREARAVSSLNHPHICTLHDIGEQDGIHYLVMEHLVGETLEARLAKGALPLEQTLEYAIQIADALDKAHRQGVVHRDLKPGNIMLVKSGAKLLDFGLAKLQAAETPTNLSALPTEQANLTAEGTILGTLQYMAPEQLEGKEADSRTDIFAFGAVVYEMATGKKAFEGKSQASLIAAIMEKDPPAMAELQPMTPPTLDHVVRRCMSKEPDKRWQVASDVMAELKWVTEVGTGIGASDRVTAPARWERALPWSVAVVLGITAVLLALQVLLGPTTDNSPQWSTILPPNSTADIAPHPAVSPDGQSVVFRARNLLGEETLWVRSFDSPSARELVGTRNAMVPFWSPDSRSVGFFDFQEGKLKRIDVSGGTPQTLADASSEPRGGTWNQDGLILFSPIWPGPLYTVSSSGGQRVQVTETRSDATGYESPHFLPGGRRFLFFDQDRSERRFTLNAGSLDSNEVQVVADFRSRAEYANGYLFYGQGSTLFAQKFDTDRLEFSGEPFRLSDRLGISWGELSNYAFSVSDDVLTYAHGGMNSESHIISLDRQGRRLETFDISGVIFGFVLSPDETRIAFDRWDPKTNSDNVWLAELATGLSTRFTFDDWWTGVPLWLPDGDRILTTDWTDSYSIKGVLDGEIEKVSHGRPAGGGWPSDWSLDGRYVVFVEMDPNTQSDVWMLPLSGEGQSIPYLNTPFNETSARLSRDSRWLAYRSDESGEYEIYVQSFPQPGKKLRVSTSGGEQPMWSKDGRKLYYLSPDSKLMAASIQFSSSSLEISERQVLFEAPLQVIDSLWRPYAVLDNGERFIFNARLENNPRSITVIKNWKSLIEDQ